MTPDQMTELRRRYRPGQSVREPGRFRPAAGETSGDPEVFGSASLAEQIIAAAARAAGEAPPQRLEAGPPQSIPTQAIASRILDAYDRALRLQGADKDDKPEQRKPGPDQTRIVATADQIIAAMKKASGVS
jgi:hypothetical protein